MIIFDDLCNSQFMKALDGIVSMRFILLFILFNSQMLSAQLDTEAALSLVKENGLVIRLNCNSAKLDTLKQIIHRGNIKEETKSKLIKERENSLLEFDEKNRRIIQSFVDEYKFSKVYFVPDSLFKEFVEGNRTMTFVDKDLKLYSNNSIPDHFVFAYFDYDMKLDVIRIRHSEYKSEILDYKMVKGIFPNKVKNSKGFFGSIKSIFSLGSDWRKDLTSTIQQLDKKLKML